MGGLHVLLLEKPFWLYVGLGLLEFVFLAVWRERRSRRTAWLLLVPVVLAGAVAAASTLVVTDREHILAGCRAIAADIVAGRTDALSHYLDDEAVVTLGAEYGATDQRKDRCIAHAAAILTRYRITNVRFGKARITVAERRGQVAVITTIDFEGPGLGPGRTMLKWGLVWVKRRAGWRMFRVRREALEVGL